jgi:hypothetical protein
MRNFKRKKARKGKAPKAVEVCFAPCRCFSAFKNKRTRIGR